MKAIITAIDALLALATEELTRAAVLPIVSQLRRAGYNRLADRLINSGGTTARTAALSMALSELLLDVKQTAMLSVDVEQTPLALDSLGNGIDPNLRYTVWEQVGYSYVVDRSYYGVYLIPPTEGCYYLESPAHVVVPADSVDPNKTLRYYRERLPMAVRELQKLAEYDSDAYHQAGKWRIAILGNLRGCGDSAWSNLTRMATLGREILPLIDGMDPTAARPGQQIMDLPLRDTILEAFGPNSTTYECTEPQELLADYRNSGKTTVAAYVRLLAEMEGIKEEQCMDAREAGGCVDDKERTERAAFMTAMARRVNTLINTLKLHDLEVMA